MKNILMIALLLIITISCDKNQRAVKNLDGEWKASKIVLKDVSEIQDIPNIPDISNLNLAALADIKINFTECELKDDDYCSMKTTVKFQNQAETGTSTGLFKVSDKGTVMEFKTSETTTATSDIETYLSTGIFKITELSDSDLKMTKGENIFEFKK